MTPASQTAPVPARDSRPGRALPPPLGRTVYTLDEGEESLAGRARGLDDPLRTALAQGLAGDGPAHPTRPAIAAGLVGAYIGRRAW